MLMQICKLKLLISIRLDAIKCKPMNIKSCTMHQKTVTSCYLNKNAVWQKLFPLLAEYNWTKQCLINDDLRVTRISLLLRTLILNETQGSKEFAKLSLIVTSTRFPFQRQYSPKHIFHENQGNYHQILSSNTEDNMHVYIGALRVKILHLYLQGIKHSLSRDNDLFGLFFDWQWTNQSCNFLGCLPLRQLNVKKKRNWQLEMFRFPLCIFLTIRQDISYLSSL